MPAVLTGAHIVCLPSYREGLPKVLVEAAACGRPLVTTDTPGCREVCRHQENGLLVKARDADALAEALRRLIEDAPLRQRLGARGRQLVEVDFSDSIVISPSFTICLLQFAYLSPAFSEWSRSWCCAGCPAAQAACRSITPTNASA
jgi:glycosyltransferase involved in cell wall biosynthesis